MVQGSASASTISERNRKVQVGDKKLLDGVRKADKSCGVAASLSVCSHDVHAQIDLGGLGRVGTVDWSQGVVASLSVLSLGFHAWICIDLDLLRQACSDIGFGFCIFTREEGEIDNEI